jgi:hypothetical protein
VPDNWTETQLGLLNSRSHLAHVARELKLDRKWRMPADKAAANLETMVRAKREPGTEVVSLTAWSSDAEEAVAIANAVRDTYEQRRKEAEEPRVRRLRQTFTEQVNRQIAEVEKARLEMLDLMKNHGIVDPAVLAPAEVGHPSQASGGLHPPAAPKAGDRTEIPQKSKPLNTADSTKWNEYATAKYRYESQLRILPAMRVDAKAQVDPPTLIAPIEILESATTVEAR